MWSMLTIIKPALISMLHPHIYLMSYSRLLSRTQEVDLTFLIFFSYFYFLLDLLSFILFLELGLELDHAVTQAGHIR